MSGLFLHELPPLLHATLRFAEERSIFLAPQLGQKLLQSVFAITNQADTNRIPQSDAHGIQLDLHRRCLTRLGKEFDVWEGCADHQQRIAFFKNLLRWSRSEQPNRPRRIRAFVWNYALA